MQEFDEAYKLSGNQRAYLTEIRSRHAVVRATVAACDVGAFLSPSVSVDLPNGSTLTLSRTRQEITEAPDLRGGASRLNRMTLWVGKTDHGGDAMFSFGDGGGLSGLLDDDGQKIEFQALDAKRCLVIQDDPLKFPRDD